MHIIIIDVMRWLQTQPFWGPNSALAPNAAMAGADDAARQFARAAESWGSLLEEMATEAAEHADASDETHEESAAAAADSADSDAYDPFDDEDLVDKEPGDGVFKEDEDETYNEEAEMRHYRAAQSVVQQAAWNLPPVAPSEIVKRKYTPEMIDDLRNESAAAHFMGQRWQSRGPPGDGIKE